MRVPKERIRKKSEYKKLEKMVRKPKTKKLQAVKLDTEPLVKEMVIPTTPTETSDDDSLSIAEPKEDTPIDIQDDNEQEKVSYPNRTVLINTKIIFKECTFLALAESKKNLLADYICQLDTATKALHNDKMAGSLSGKTQRLKTYLVKAKALAALICREKLWLVTAGDGKIDWESVELNEGDGVIKQMTAQLTKGLRFADKTVKTQHRDILQYKATIYELQAKEKIAKENEERIKDLNNSIKVFQKAENVHMATVTQLKKAEADLRKQRLEVTSAQRLTKIANETAKSEGNVHAERVAKHKTTIEKLQLDIVSLQQALQNAVDKQTTSGFHGGDDDLMQEHIARYVAAEAKEKDALETIASLQEQLRQKPGKL